MKTINQIKIEKKKVLLRADFNEPIENGELLEDERIKEGSRTINYILDSRPALLLLLSHLGRPEGQRDSAFSLKPVAKRLGGILNREVQLLDRIEQIGKILQEPDSSKVFLLENIRFWPEEEAGEKDFARKVAEGFDVFVNDAFSASHRAHASLYQMPKITKEKCAGLLFQEEYSQLSKLFFPNKPAVAVIGGAKIETKLPVIENLAKSYDKVLIGGKIANEALDQKLDLPNNVILPIDFSPGGCEIKRFDIGRKTIETFMAEINQAKTIVWNGPLGKFEEDDYAVGTKEVLRAIAENGEAYRVIGGGETLEAVEKFGNLSDFNYVSMSGGAMLEFLSGKQLPGIEALK